MVSRNYPLLRWYNFFYDFRPYMVVAVLYYAQVTGSFALGLTVFAVASVASAVFELPTGIFSDRVGRKKTVIAGSVSSVVAMVLYAFGGSFAWLAVGAVFNGLTRSLLSGNNDALLYDTLKQQGKSGDFADKLGKTKSMFELGLGASSLLAAGLATVSLQAVMIASILPQVLCAFISLRFVEPTVHSDKIEENIYGHLRKALRAFKRNTKLRRLSAAYMIDYAIGETYYQFKPAFVATVWPTWALGIARAIESAAGFLGYHFAGRVVRRFGALRTLFSQHVLGMGATLLSAGIPTPVSPLLININSFFFGIAETASGTLMQHEFTDRQRATMGSLNALGGSILYTFVTVGIGFAADAVGPAKTIILLTVLSVPVAVIYWQLLSTSNPD